MSNFTFVNFYCILFMTGITLFKTLIAIFDRKFPELFKWFKEFLGYKDSSPMETPGFKERTSGELAHLEIGKKTVFEIGRIRQCNLIVKLHISL